MLSKLFEFKEIIDNKLKEDIKYSFILLGAAFAVLFIIEKITNLIWNAMPSSFLWIGVLFSIFVDILTLVYFIILSYLVHFNMDLIQKYLKVNKLQSFVIGYSAIALISILLSDILQGQGFHLFEAIFNLTGVIYFFNGFKSFISNIINIYDISIWYGLLFSLMIIISSLIYTILTLKHLAIIFGYRYLNIKYPQYFNDGIIEVSNIIEEEMNLTIEETKTMAYVEDVDSVIKNESDVIENVSDVIENVSDVVYESYDLSQMNVDLYISLNKRFFGNDKVAILYNKISKMNEDQFLKLLSVQFEDPAKMTVVSLALGMLGIDRFMLGETGMGILKLLTGGCCGVLTIIDWFTIGKKVKEKNLNKFIEL